MTKIRVFTCLICALLLATASFAAGPETHERHKISIQMEDLDEIRLELDDMEEGDTRQFFTDSGKEVLVTKEKHGFKLDVDGKELKVVTPHHGDVRFGDKTANVFIASGDDTQVIGIGSDDEDHVWISADEGSAAGSYKVMVKGHGDHEARTRAVWVGKDGESHLLGDDAKYVFIERESTADQLAESGLLDGVDDETREKILEFLRTDERHVVHHEAVFFGEKKDEEENE